ncbi:carbohydrate ABC transporter permease [Kaarinaea lacus]
MLKHILLLILALGFIAPLFFMFIGSLKPDDTILGQVGGWRALWPNAMSLENFQDVFRRVDFLTYVWNSVYIVSVITIVGLVVNSMAGYALARLQWRGREVVLLLVLALMVVPLEAIAVPLFYQVNILGLRNTYTALILPFMANAFFIYLFYTYFLGLPKELEEAALIDGAGPMKTYAFIIVPNAKPVFAAVTILSFLTHWGSFLWPLMVTSTDRVMPLSLAISTFYSLPPLQWGDIFAFGVLMVTPVMLVFVLFQRWFVRGVAATGVKG